MYWSCQQSQAPNQCQGLPYWPYSTESYPLFPYLPVSTSPFNADIPWNSAYVVGQNGLSWHKTKGERSQNVQQPRINSAAKENQNICRNTKSLIIRDFVKGLKKDPSSLLILKQRNHLECSIKSFIDYLQEKIPDQSKYIRLSFFLTLCRDSKNPEFSGVLRTLFYNHLRVQYQSFILSKKKNKISYLRACRELI